MIKVAVYGTLRFGFVNYDRFLRGAPYLGRGLTGFDAELYGRGIIPFLKKAPESGRRVVVEVYEVCERRLARLDVLEGHPDIYRRERLPVLLSHNGEKVSAWVYVFQGGVEGGFFLDYEERLKGVKGVDDYVCV